MNVCMYVVIGPVAKRYLDLLGLSSSSSTLIEADRVRRIVFGDNQALMKMTSLSSNLEDLLPHAVGSAVKMVVREKPL